MEVGGIFHINSLDAWQGSFSTGGGYRPRPQKKKEENPSDQKQPEPPEGVTRDDSGVVHVDLTA
ncbi:MAG: hypothetical protein KJ050_15075 [Candidatus Omnitrophica bacterium]|nr:hypothetical protein [Candidatus Omnitrophota bacterium]MCC6733311.1 hypothetical protein [Candidatus Omnitrophota bacterium]MCK6496018.1 hypothetical protein [bacterium]MCL4736252.1 hypothetical protein [Candidatus Omnitrophota bacterium]NUP91310.1 hypothetical protein [Candidatus Omnitrophota bacterium]